VLFLIEVLTPKSRELKGHKVDDFLCGYLRLELELHKNIIAALLLFVEHPAVAADHYIFAQLSEIGREVSFVGEITVLVVVGNH
jgi:hypothetical protein